MFLLMQNQVVQLHLPLTLILRLSRSWRWKRWAYTFLIPSMCNFPFSICTIFIRSKLWHWLNTTESRNYAENSAICLNSTSCSFASQRKYIHNVFSTQLHTGIVLRWNVFPSFRLTEPYTGWHPKRPHLISFNRPKMQCRLPPHHVAACSQYSRCGWFWDNKPVHNHYRHAPCIQAVSQ
jgi:hypothetical protein